MQTYHRSEQRDQIQGSKVEFWAKTVAHAASGQAPGISVFHHCLNVGCVGERLSAQLPRLIAALLPPGTNSLIALHDIGKITLGFQSKCPAWLAAQAFDDLTLRQIAQAGASGRLTADHAYVGQLFLQERLRLTKSQGWAVAVGAHHGKPKGNLNSNKYRELIEAEPRAAEMQAHREAVAALLIDVFGALPDYGPQKLDGRDDSSLWLLAGLITVADWIGSNEVFFSPEQGQPLEATRKAAASALAQIGWPGGRLRASSFFDTFHFQPNAVQQVLLAAVQEPALIIVEAPMGCGKTEAALALAQQLIAAGHHQGLYFALPTQVTSDRIHQRVARFLENALADAAHLRLAHGNSWLHDDQDLLLRPSFTGGPADDNENPHATVAEARSWFSSSKQALLAPYGVGTIDQALQGMVAVKHFFVRRFALAGKVVILDEVHSYDVYTGSLVTALVRELLRLGCTVLILSATLTAARRRELLAAAGSHELASPDAYPLITTARHGESATQIAPAFTATKTIRLRSTVISEDETIAELIARAEAGQHVLWIRNTVVEAQQAFRLIRGDTPVAALPDDQIKTGLLHSRFPQIRRAELEADWLEHLGKNRPAAGPGSILVATQVVEQSVDIDLDFIVSDLAPTDMLLQRVGRLWRHPRPHRAAPDPEFWIRTPELPAAADPRTLEKALGRSAKVYASWVLLRSAAAFSSRTTLTLPDDIRPLLETTYAEPHPEEPAAWGELHAKLEEEKRQLTLNAEAAMLVLGRPTVDDDKPEALTRRKGPPTVSVLLLRLVEPMPGRLARLTTLDDQPTCQVVSDYEWSLAGARFIHPWLVRVPRWVVPASAPSPRWLGLHVPGAAVVATLREDGRLLWDGEPADATYHRDFGVRTEKPVSTRPSFQPTDDDEFDY
jgi:CRISPR-associated endonuclease/helicase Cas3